MHIFKCYKTTDGTVVQFDSEFTLNQGDYVLVDFSGHVPVVDRVLPKDYVENWPGSASTLENANTSIEVIA